MELLLGLIKRTLNKILELDYKYSILPNGGTLAVGLSGGKDSLITLWALNEVLRHRKHKYKLCAVLVDQGFPGFSYDKIKEYLFLNDIPYIEKKSFIYNSLSKADSPCAICSHLRRGALVDGAKIMGATHLALGHHLDDLLEGVIMTIAMNGRPNVLLPIKYLSRRDIYLIRPLLLVEEEHIKTLSKKIQGINPIESECPYSINSERIKIKKWLYQGYNNWHVMHQHMASWARLLLEKEMENQRNI